MTGEEACCDWPVREEWALARLHTMLHLAALRGPADAEPVAWCWFDEQGVVIGLTHQPSVVEKWRRQVVTGDEIVALCEHRPAPPATTVEPRAGRVCICGHRLDEHGPICDNACPCFVFTPGGASAEERDVLDVLVEAIGYTQAEVASTGTLAPPQILLDAIANVRAEVARLSAALDAAKRDAERRLGYYGDARKAVQKQFDALASRVDERSCGERIGLRLALSALDDAARALRDADQASTETTP